MTEALAATTDVVAASPRPPARTKSARQATVLQIIERAARDPSVDIDKMERLIAMQERIQAKQAQIEYDNAMKAAQEGMGRVRTDAHNSQTKSKYATYPALDKALRPIYTKHGFSLSFSSGEGAPAGEVRISCRIAHVGGHREIAQIDMPADGKGPQGNAVMTRTHATGSAATYGQRYLLKLIFNIAIGDDDDGNGADGHKPGAPGSAGAGGQFRPERRTAAEPQRDDFRASADGSPHNDQAGDGTAAGGAKASGRPVTDVMTFENYRKTTDFVEFSDHFLHNTTPDGAKQWRAFYADPLAFMSGHTKKAMVEAYNGLAGLFNDLGGNEPMVLAKVPADAPRA